MTGSMDWMKWACKVPGKPGTDWEGVLTVLPLTSSITVRSLPMS